MNGFYRFVDRMNIGYWLLGIFIFHLALYLILRSDHWIFATIAATATYAVLLSYLKSVARRKKRGVL